MEIIDVELRTFEAMLERVETLARRVDVICRGNGDKSLQKWLDNQEVCQLLGISKRTLQTYRDNGTLDFTKIGHKMFYRPEDEERVINKLKSK